MNQKTLLSAFLAAPLLSPASAALINAGGNVTLVSTTVFDTAVGSATVGAASDGNSASTPNGQLFTDDPGSFPSDYFAFAGPVIFDINLGGTFQIDGISFWNRGNINGNGVTSFNAIFSTDSTFGNGDDSALFAFTPGNIGGAQQDLPLGTVVNDAQFVRITIDDNDEGVFIGGDRVGFTEFQFNAVPEPAGVSLALIGLMAFSMRRRR